MHLSKHIQIFLEKAHSDPRIGTTHIALYLSILNMWYLNSGDLAVYNRQVMKLAKISSTSTYSKLLKDLTEGGYIVFEPSYYKKTPSTLAIIDLETSKRGLSQCEPSSSQYPRINYQAAEDVSYQVQ